jgi:hypothetical protein
MSKQHKITAHISPYIDGLAAETHEFVAYLNEEAAKHKTRVRFVATANRIEAIGNLERAAKSSTLGGWLLRRALAAGYLATEKKTVWLYRPIREQTARESSQAGQFAASREAPQAGEEPPGERHARSLARPLA